MNLLKVYYDLMIYEKKLKQNQYIEIESLTNKYEK